MYREEGAFSRAYTFWLETSSNISSLFCWWELNILKDSSQCVYVYVRFLSFLYSSSSSFLLLLVGCSVCFTLQRRSNLLPMCFVWLETSSARFGHWFTTTTTVTTISPPKRTFQPVICQKLHANGVWLSSRSVANNKTLLKLYFKQTQGERKVNLLLCVWCTLHFICLLIYPNWFTHHRGSANPEGTKRIES